MQQFPNRCKRRQKVRSAPQPTAGGWERLFGSWYRCCGRLFGLIPPMMQFIIVDLPAPAIRPMTSPLFMSNETEFKAVFWTSFFFFWNWLCLCRMRECSMRCISQTRWSKWWCLLHTIQTESKSGTWMTCCSCHPTCKAAVQLRSVCSSESRRVRMRRLGRCRRCCSKQESSSFSL